MNLKDEIALVTGATRGIGQAIAAALGEVGATVVGTATSASGAERISAALAEKSIQGTGMVLDVTDPDAIDEVVKKIGADYGATTILVNNAGITRDNLLLRMKPEEWAEVLDTNLGAIYRLSRACLRGMMKARHGRIVNIASVVGLSGNPGQTNYSAAKAGMLGFTKSLAREVASRDITVNAVAPGFIDTEMTQALTEAQREPMLAQVPLHRLGRPEDVAAAVRFLASPEAAYITGETLHVNGGMLMV
ncbi:MAG TPA: 3-oxoacyl-ACP reductase FabG [Gammaproteobacteria bacterium]|nr:3-oxoacyl-ACP reductase FabG [Gammaproteobacteria bacterium]